ncbi:MAG TPA: T9SS type A sorting domain-containing protein [Flavihumibacter sp.]|nr:T9SS type A sorting domain-containing protein [Bacteroidota bacterium]HOA37545.1 T9SS type A sorting domain-containing protein [Flavihumibacter sp.]HPZ86467.1 T9SS type A sorting domain-containing protein [Flavihumibacter sp.]HQD09601.1 T9SS type A sorting domain-containing protein [Flavihumibacter sp.]
MRLLLTHFLSVALLCAFHNLAAQPVFPAQDQALLPADSGMQETSTISVDETLLELEEPMSSGRGKLQLRWRWKEKRDSGYLRVERSALQNGPYEVLSVIRLDVSQPTGGFTDDLPLRGLNHYRLVYVSTRGDKKASRTVSTGLAGEMSCRFYPNPVDNILIVRAEQPLEMLLSDASGKPRLALKLKAGLQTVDVSNLDKGLYIITLIQTDTGRHITEKLMKN